ncbi:MAG TPA: adenylosuccinate synthetase, partial [Thermoplasmata archaeon]|nr:adenylosuccinate synthetase [Thermoplasmata archaeon]
KAWRIGIRIADLFSSDLESKVERNRAVKAALLDGLGLEADLPTTAEVTEALRRRAGEIRDMVTDTSRFLVESLESDRWVLFEGAQGILLDVDFGTYPFVTSSSTGVGGASIGTGVPVRHLQRVLGVVKAYQTRVGEGPMPTEISRPLAERLRVKGGEYGVTTGRPRRCGFLDLVALRHAIRVSGITSIALTKADVLCGLDSVNVAKAYMINGKHHTTPPADPAMLARAEPVYDEFPAWDEIDRDSVRREGYEAFPQELKEYVQYIERSTDTCVNIISYGPKRDETVVLRDPWGS